MALLFLSVDQTGLRARNLHGRLRPVLWSSCALRLCGARTRKWAVSMAAFNTTHKSWQPARLDPP